MNSNLHLRVTPINACNDAEYHIRTDKTDDCQHFSVKGCLCVHVIGWVTEHHMYHLHPG